VDITFPKNILPPNVKKETVCFFGNAGTHLSVYKVSDLENSYLINVGNLKNMPCQMSLTVQKVVGLLSAILCSLKREKYM
jgi:hypothetical protein